MGNKKRLRISREIIRKRRNERDIELPDLRLYLEHDTSKLFGNSKINKTKEKSRSVT